MKIRPPLHVSFDNSVIRPYLKNPRHVFLKTLPVRFFKYGLVTELLRETCKGGLILSILAAYVPGNLNKCHRQCAISLYLTYLYRQSFLHMLYSKC